MTKKESRSLKSKIRERNIGNTRKHGKLYIEVYNTKFYV